MQKEYSPFEIINLLVNATKLQKILWTRLTDYIFYNNSNQAILNFTKLFSETHQPVTLDDPPKVDLMKSYFCEFEGVSFCLMHFLQVLKPNNSPEEFYHLMVQATPFSNFGYYSTPDPTFQEPLQELLNLVEMQNSQIYTSIYFLNRTLAQLESKINNFDPFTDEVLKPLPPAPHCKHSCVIDSEGYYKTLVLVYLETDENGEKHENIQNYELKPGERLLDANVPDSLIKARWNGTAWEEGASKAEIKEYRKTHRY